MRVWRTGLGNSSNPSWSRREPAPSPKKKAYQAKNGCYTRATNRRTAIKLRPYLKYQPFLREPWYGPSAPTCEFHRSPSCSSVTFLPSDATKCCENTQAEGARSCRVWPPTEFHSILPIGKHSALHIFGVNSQKKFKSQKKDQEVICDLAGSSIAQRAGGGTSSQLPD